MTTDHFRPVLDNVSDSHLFFTVAEQFSRAHTPQVIVNIIRMGRMNALQKDDGGVRGTVAGYHSRLVARTVAQQLSPIVERMTAPFQHAMTTRAGTECVALQALTEADPTATVMSLDGVSARFDIAESDAGKFGCNPWGVTGFAVRANVPQQSFQLSVGKRQW